MIEVLLAQEQDKHSIDEQRLIAAAQSVIADAGIVDGEISIAVVSDEQMHDLNRRYLDHDYPTDVLSFVLDQEDGRLEGEIVVSADYAAREAERFGWSLDDELTLYVIHGSLHLVGYDDQTPEAKRLMREQEVKFLRHFGLEPRFDDGASL
jgi:probable rRNA maturation factor